MVAYCTEIPRSAVDRERKKSSIGATCRDELNDGREAYEKYEDSEVV